jgi:hypothetical protein
MTETDKKMKVDEEQLYCMNDLKDKYTLVYIYGDINDSVILDFDPSKRIENLKKTTTDKLEIYLTLRLERYKKLKNTAHEIVQRLIKQVQKK